jgi:tetratricopeptide (TPR) repeat protein
LVEHALRVREAQLGRDHLETTLARQELAEMLDALSRFREAEPLYRASVRGLERALGPRAPRVAAAQLAHASLLDALGQHEEAMALYSRGLSLQREVLGPGHVGVANSLLNLAVLLNQRGRHEDAKAALEEALAIWAEPSADRAFGLRDLGSTLVYLRRYGEAAALYSASIPLFRKFHGDDSPELWRAVAFLGDALSRQGKLEEGERHLRQAVARLEATAGPSSYQIRMPLRLLAETRRKQGDLVEAIAVLRRVRALELELFGTEEHRDVAVTDRRLGIALTQLGDGAALREARTRLDHAVRLDRELRPGTWHLGESLAASARLRRKLGVEPAEVRAELAEAATLFAATLDAEDPRRLEVAAELAELPR